MGSLSKSDQVALNNAWAALLRTLGLVNGVGSFALGDFIATTGGSSSNTLTDAGLILTTAASSIAITVPTQAIADFSNGGNTATLTTDSSNNFVVTSPQNKLVGSIADGASALANILNTTNTLANAGARIASFQNAGVEKFGIDATGKIRFPVGGAADTGGITASMASGSVTVTTSAVTSNSVISLTHAGTGTLANYGTLYVFSITGGTSFVIKSTNGSDNDKVYWNIDN